MAIRRFGDWERAKELLCNNPGQRLALAIRQATIKNALLLVREIKRGIRDQAPGGKQFAPLAQVTIDRKGSSKALIDTGFLVNSITQKIMSDRAFVGLLRTSFYKGGESAANIGAIMEFGATINHPERRGDRHPAEAVPASDDGEIPGPGDAELPRRSALGAEVRSRIGADSGSRRDVHSPRED